MGYRTDYEPNAQLKIILADTNPDIIDAWKAIAKDDYPNVTTHYGSIFDLPSDAIVSPSNSFGFMDGGVDWYITDYLDKQLQEELQDEIKLNWSGELKVGEATYIHTNHEIFRYLISAPTMRVPLDIRGTTNVYQSVKAALYLAKWDLFQHSHINTVTFPGMGTGCGMLPPEIFAVQFKAALEDYENCFDIGFPETLQEAAIKNHYLTFGVQF